MPIPLPGTQYHDAPRRDEYNMEEFPQRNQGYANNGANPFGDQGVHATAMTAPGIAGVGAAGVATGQEMRYRGPSVSPFGGHGEEYADMGPVMGDGMGFDSGRYPVPGRSRSFKQGHAVANSQNSLGGRSPSMSSSGHSHSMGMTTSSRTPAMPTPPLQRIPQTQEQEDEDPYDGFTPESERSEPHLPHDEDPEHVEETPRVLRVSPSHDCSLSGD
jgi:hypothetical protein